MRRFLFLAAAAVALPATAALPTPADQLVGTWECRVPGAPPTKTPPIVWFGPAQTGGKMIETNVDLDGFARTVSGDLRRRSRRRRLVEGATAGRPGVPRAAAAGARQDAGDVAEAGQRVLQLSAAPAVHLELPSLTGVLADARSLPHRKA